MLVKLNRDTFFRQYEDIGYLYNQSTKMDLIIDNVGTIFLSFVDRTSRSVNEIVEKLYLLFEDVKENELENDFVDFIYRIEREGLIITGQDESEIKLKELNLSHNQKSLTYPNIEKTDFETSCSSLEYLTKYFNKHPRLFRILIELTSKCNFECIHCYLPKNNFHQIAKEKIFEILDQLKIMGTLEVTFSGGELLLNKDLSEILLYAKKNDFLITVMTNGSLLNDEIINTLQEINLARVQVSFYSMEPSVHDFITGKVGSWEKKKKNIDKLINKKIRVEIACPILKENSNSFQKVIEYFENIGVSVGNDLSIIAKSDFSKENLNHRVDKNDIKSIIKNILDSKQSYKDLLLNKNINVIKRCPDDSVCGIGTDQMCISANGDYYPCPGFGIVLGNVFNQSIDYVWSQSPAMIKLRELKNSLFPKCMECDSINYCRICPAKFYNESGGDYLKINEYFCEIAKSNKEIAEEYINSDSTI